MKIDDARTAATAVDAAIDSACRLIAPTWPLDRSIAVNPYWGWIHRPFDEAARELARLGPTSLFMPRAFYLDAWKRSVFGLEDIARALQERNSETSPEDIVAALTLPDARSPTLPLLSDVIDERRKDGHLPPWHSAITHQVSQHCAAYFDEGQADWEPDREAGLYATWKRMTALDNGIEWLMAASGITSGAAILPDQPRVAIAFMLDTLKVRPERREAFLAAVLMRIGGWAAWCAWLRWQARLDGGDDQHIVELLAIRLAWEFLLDDGNRGSASNWTAWHHAWDLLEQTDDDSRFAEATAQRALERAYQRSVAWALLHGSPARAPNGPSAVQAVFCIDVRSELFRRALESVAPTVQTLGFAGFFGLPVSYAPLATQAYRPQLPGLLAPTMTARELTDDPPAVDRIRAYRRDRLAAAAAREPFLRLPGSAFMLIESIGLFQVADLLRRSLPFPFRRGAVDREALRASEAARLRIRLDLPGSDRAMLAESVLRAMSLTSGFARLVLLAGHGSRTVNNPHASALDCGACCGQTGEVNARALAGLLNDQEVRVRLAERGIDVPDETHFVGGLHDTTTDEVSLFETDLVPASHLADLAALRVALRQAGDLARAGRAPALGLAPLAGRPRALLRALRNRGADWAQTRPEWGLANNAAFIVAPRSRTRGIDLQGRSFLHDYDWQRDTDGGILETIMTAPMVVTHWINMQYHASTVDNRRYGSGNKVLHNVVGAHLGVFEGNGGDLRIGLPMQSLHDGERWMHTPQRLSVFIDAPRAMIERVVDRHVVVRTLVSNGWLHLLHWDPESGAISRWHEGRWVEI